ncbi:MAG TPA: hypothetical protein VM688_02160 [Nocardioidaceae bacterium]|nr:hypothetical protein [Nocardioidaceae bacterium]
MAVEDWLRSLALLYPVPEGYREPQLKRAEALDMLRCGPEAFDELLAAGLPSSEGPDSPLFDRTDLINLALNSRSGQSKPERAVQFALRWMHEDPRTWVIPLSWNFSIEIQDAVATRGGVAEESWSHTRFLPELTGGLIQDWRSSSGVRLTPDSFEFHGPGPISFSGRMQTSGALRQLRSPTLRAITEDFLHRGYRWARLPEMCQYDYAPILAKGVAPCVAASLYLEEEFRRAGYEANTRGGWILGMLDLAHSWIEVVDDDGIVKPIDAVFERLSLLSAAPHPDLPSACLGSTLNRLLPAAIPAGVPGALHTVDGQSRPATTRTVIRRVGAR